MNTKLTFTTKDEYIAWRAEWRRQYAAKSEEIRAIRRDIREAQHDGICGTVGRLTSDIRYLRAEATEMIALRHASKIRSQEQYLAAKAKAALQIA